jgi:hypothetical protein
MRIWTAAVLGVVGVVAIASCSQNKQPPIGRWEGTYETADEMVVARVEIVPNGTIYLSAPDALNITGVPDDQRAPMRARLAATLASDWGSVEGRTLEFDGRVFRKPGGIAPQMEWNPDSQTMTVVAYLGMKTVRIPLRAVKDFSADPWAG